MKQQGDTVVAMPMPRKHIEFIQNNPKLCEEVGKIVTKLVELDQFKKILSDILSDARLFEQHLVSGSKEELQSFLNVMNESYGRSHIFQGAVGEGDKFLANLETKLKEKDPNVTMLRTDIVKTVTDKGV